MPEFYCPECMQTFDLFKGQEVECPHCGSMEALPTSEAAELETK